MTSTISRTCIVAMLSIGVTAYAQTTGQSPTQPTSQAGSQRMEQGRQAGDRVQTEQQITLVGCIQREADFRQANQGGRGGALGTGIGAGNEFVLINASSGSQTAMSGSAGAPTGTMTGSATAGTTGTTASGTTATTGSATGTTSGTGSTTGTATGTGTTGSATATTPSHTQHSGMSVTSGGTAYALTGDREKDLEQYVGQRVEIVGRIEGGSNRGGYSAGGSASGTGTTASGTASGTTASGTPASGTTASGTTASGTTATGTTSGTTASPTGATPSAGSQAQSVGSLQQLNIVSFRAVGGSCSAQ